MIRGCTDRTDETRNDESKNAERRKEDRSCAQHLILTWRRRNRLTEGEKVKPCFKPAGWDCANARKNKELLMTLGDFVFFFL